jgi:hypothetical protein
VPKVFISCARQNERDIDQLVEHLRVLGCDTWVDTSLHGGQDWWGEVLRQIEDCDVFIAIISREALNSVACEREFDWAEALGKPVLPVAVEPPTTALPRRYSRRQVVDYSDPADRDRAARRLGGGLLSLPPAPPPPRPLPRPPAAPLSYLTDLVEMVSKRNVLNHDQQRQVLQRLEPALQAVDPEERRGGRIVLEKFSSRDDLYADVDRGITALKRLNDEASRAFAAEPRREPEAPAGRVGASEPSATPRRRLGVSAGSRARADRLGGDRLSSSVFAPPSVEGGQVLLVQVFAHLPEQAAQVAALAREFDEAAQRRGFAALHSSVLEGERLMFELRLPGLVVDDPVQSMVWIGQPQSVQFGVTVPTDFPPQAVIGTVTVSRDSVPIGHLKFQVSVGDPGATLVRREQGPCSHRMHRYRRAFISYASADRKEVLKRTQMLAGVGIDFFQDLLTLEPGQRWERHLYSEIDRCDLFLLFWSSAAKKSTWVLKEVHHALMCNGGNEFAPPEILPVIIEGPPPVEPPPELTHLHFNDRMIYFMQPKRTNLFARLRRRGG